MGIKEKLSWLLEQRGRGSVTELGKHLGVPHNYVSRWAKSEKYAPPIDKIGEIAKFFGVTTDYLLDDSRSVWATGKIPIIGNSSCGVPAAFPCQGIDYIEASVWEAGEAMYAIYVKEAPAGVRFSSGDLLVCDGAARAGDCDIVHYSHAGESGLARVRYSEGGASLCLLPLSRNRAPIVVALDGDSSPKISRCERAIVSLP
jgi:transcriptional regulator with XRE-family HTH domain